MIYKIYFNNRSIYIANPDDKKNQQLTKENIICKSTKSFDKAYNEFLNNNTNSELNVFCSSPDAFFKHLKTKFKVIKAAGGLVLNSEGELLIIKRQGFWDLPKGKIEHGESKRDAALREVQEECGVSNLNITSKIGKTYHTYQLKDQEILKITYWYQMHYSANETPSPQTEEGISEVRWIKRNEIAAITENTHHNLIDLFRKFQNS